MQQWQVGPVPDITYFNNPNHQNDMQRSAPHSYPADISRRPEHYQYGQPPPSHSQHQAPVQPPMNVSQPAAAAPSQQQAPPPAPAPTGRRNKRSAPGANPPAAVSAAPPTPATPATAPVPPAPAASTPTQAPAADDSNSTPSSAPPSKKSRTNTPWTPAEELRLKKMRDTGSSWAEIAKTFPTRTEGSVKKHWYKDMHYAEFAESESQALLSAIKEYENNKWKTIGAKVGKPAKACEQYAKEHFPDLFGQPKQR